MALCRECAVSNPDEVEWCVACGAPLALAAAGRSARKRVTIVCADIRGSTQLAGRLEPESLRGITGRYFAWTRTAIERHGGTVEKFIGDAVLAVFGLPLLHADDALRAVRAAVEIRDGLSALNAELEREFGVSLAIGVGVNTGEVIAGDPADGQFFATGEAVNVAARLQEAAGPGEILVGAPTYRLVRDAVTIEPHESLALRGKRGLTEVVRLVGLAKSERMRPGSPLVGRERELRLLASTFDRVVVSRACRLLTVVGSAGVGKSRLARQLLAARAADAAIVHGRCLPYGEGITFWPLKEAVGEAAGLSGGESAAEAERKIRDLVARAPDADLIVDRVVKALDVAEPVPGHGGTFWAFGRLFEQLARRRPLILLFDDIQWGEPTFLDLVEYLAVELRGAPILLLCLARPELFDTRLTWGTTAAGEVLVLEPLPERDAAQLAADLLGGSAEETSTVSRIVEVAEGNPFFVEELVAMLIDDGRLRRRHGAWKTPDDLSPTSLPPTIGALLAARIDGLPVAERAALERASVEGKIFHRDAVLRLTPPDDRAELDTHLNALVLKDLIEPAESGVGDENAFGFRHQLLRDAAYESLPKTRRAQLHERFATWLEEQAGQRVGEYAEILGYHLEQARRYLTELGPATDGTRALGRRAATHLSSSGLRAYARGDMSAAAKLLARALDLGPADTADRQELRTKLEDALFETGQLRRTKLSPASLRCFWRWPLGHRWAVRERYGRRVLRCAECGKAQRRERRAGDPVPIGGPGMPWGTGIPQQ